MKNSIYKLFGGLFLGLSIFGCEVETGEELDFSNTVDAYVRFDTPDVELSSSEASSVTITPYVPITLAEDIILTYEVEGTAVEGVDYILSNEDGLVNTTEKTITIKHVEVSEDVNQTEVTVEFPWDGVDDGTKALSIKIVNAVTVSGKELNIGHTGEFTTSNITIANSVCDFSIAGSYDVVMNWYGDEIEGEADITIVEGQDFLISDITGEPDWFGGEWDYIVTQDASDCDNIIPTGPSSFASVDVTVVSYDRATGTLVLDCDYGSGYYVWTSTFTLRK